MLNIITKLMSENDCYKAGRTITPRGITIHSTAEPGMRAGVSVRAVEQKRKRAGAGAEVCVHAFADDEIVMQYLPWTMRGWHAGGTDNNDHIGIELCEPAGMIYTDDFDVADYDTAENAPCRNPQHQNHRCISCPPVRTAQCLYGRCYPCRPHASRALSRADTA